MKLKRSLNFKSLGLVDPIKQKILRSKRSSTKWTKCHPFSCSLSHTSYRDTCTFSKLIRNGLLLMYLLLTLSSFSQSFKPEKIYLQLGSNAFALDEDIWFKAIVTDAESHYPTEISGVLYVDLINSNAQVVAHKLVKLENGIGQGSLELQQKHPQGHYLIRAYTQWNRNFGDDFEFKIYVNLISIKENKNKSPIDSLALTENDQGKYLLTGQLWPQRMGQHDQKKIKVNLDWGVAKDSFNVKSKNDDAYSLAYELPKTVEWLNISLENEDGERHTETIVFNESKLDVQFFPEGGKLVQGFLNKIGFKAIGIDGKGRKVHGKVFNSQEEEVAVFESNHLGMGSFYLKAESSAIYHSKVSMSNTENSTFQYLFPDVVPNGSILSVARTRDKIKATVISNELTGSVAVKVSCRGKDYYQIEGQLQAGNLNFELPSNDLPEGIILFTLFNAIKMPIAERLFFNETAADRMDISLKTDKSAYAQRDLTKLDITLSQQDGATPNADLSVLVINEEHWHQGMGKDIRSYFLMDSELRGEVEEPSYYFKDDNPNRLNDIDALLLTQGWRSYKFPAKRVMTNFYWPQAGLSVKGMVRSLNRKPIENVDLTLATFGKSSSFYVESADSLGRFNFELDDIYEHQIKLLLQAKNVLNAKKKYTIYLDTFPIPKVSYEYKPHIKKVDRVERALIQTEKRREKIRSEFDFTGINQLDEVVLDGKNITEQQRKANKDYGKPDVIIKGDAIRKKEKNWSYGLYSILMFNYADEIYIETFTDGFSLAHIRRGRNEPTLLVVDGRLLKKHEYEIVPHMSPKIVESVQLIKNAKYFQRNYLSVFPDTDALKAPAVGHIISIYTKGSVGIYGSTSPDKLETTIAGFSPIKEFYTPKYDKPVLPEAQQPDFRSLVYWAPSIPKDKDGNTVVSFYNPDIPGNYVIVVEAISTDGRIGYHKKMYRVE